MIDSELFHKIIKFLQTTEQDNPDLINYITSHKDNLLGPVSVDQNMIQRTIGPEPQMLNHETIDEFKTKVDSIVGQIKASPPTSINLLCEKHDNTYYLLDGNHTFEALKILGTTQFSVIYSNDSVIHEKIVNKFK